MGFEGWCHLAKVPDILDPVEVSTHKLAKFSGGRTPLGQTPTIELSYLIHLATINRSIWTPALQTRGDKPHNLFLSCEEARDERHVYASTFSSSSF
jgi:hypothetical protein